MKKVIRLICFCYCLILLSSCNSCNPKSGTAADGNNTKREHPFRTVKLQQQWTANSGYAGEVFAQYDNDTLNKINVEVIPGSDQIDTKQIVLSGQADFGVAGAEQILQADEKGANLVVIGVINYKSLACFISKKDKNILGPRDMVGKRIGTMEGSPVDLIYQALKKKEHLNISPSNEIPTGWVLTGFIHGDYDVYPAFLNDEPIKLKLQGIEVNIIKPANCDINFIGTVYFCKRSLIDTQPELVQAFINSVAKGWENTMTDPKKALGLIRKYDANIDTVKELQSIITGMDYYKGEEGKVLYARKETWDAMAKTLVSLGKIKSYDFKTSVDNDFVSWYHNKIKLDRDAKSNE